MNAEKSFSENPAGQVSAQLAFYKTRNRRALFTGTREKALDILSDDFVKKCALRDVALVVDGLGPEQDRV